MKPWTSSEIAFLRKNAGNGDRFCALKLGRSVHSVRRKARDCSISLRRAGENRGRRLGEIAGEKRTAKDGVSDEAVIRRVLDKQAGKLAICPSCGREGKLNARTGFCGCCHKRELKEAHDAEARELEATRAYNVSKQRLKRLRSELGVKAPNAREES